MKSLPICVSKQSAIKKIAKRSTNRIKNFTKISDSLSDTQKRVLNENIEEDEVF